MKRFVLGLVCIGLTACGGGGSSDDSGSEQVVSFDGVYDGTVARQNVDCPVDLPDYSQTINSAFPHTVIQEGSSVTLQTSNGIDFVGATEGNEGFLVSRPIDSSDVNGYFCEGGSLPIRYDHFENDGLTNTADVSIDIHVTCSKDGVSLDCSDSYQGQVRSR